MHLDGRVTGDYMRETSAIGTSFLVPVDELAAQGTGSFDISSPPPDNSNTAVIGAKFTYTTEAQAQRWENTWFMGPSITGTTPENAHVELLVTGDQRRRIYLSFEESCGFFHLGPTPKGESAMKGAHGQRILTTPGRDDRAHAHEQTREQLLRHRPGRLARTQRPAHQPHRLLTRLPITRATVRQASPVSLHQRANSCSPSGRSGTRWSVPAPLKGYTDQRCRLGVMPAGAWIRCCRPDLLPKPAGHSL